LIWVNRPRAAETSVTIRRLASHVRPVGNRLAMKGRNVVPPLDKVYVYIQYGGLKMQKQDKVMTIPVNAPESINAFSAEMHYPMSRIWEDVAGNPGPADT
jgi:hypothetical protein